MAEYKVVDTEQLESNLTAIGNAIRGKTNKTELLSLSQMPTEINNIATGGVDIPKEALVLSGDISYRFRNGGWDWFFNKYKNQMSSNNITEARRFLYESKIKEIPFDLNFYNPRNSINYDGIFENAKYLEKIKSIHHQEGSTSYQKVESMSEMFLNCFRLRELPTLYNFTNNLDIIKPFLGFASVFDGCHSLRKIPKELLSKMVSSGNDQGSYYEAYYNTYNSCYALNELIGLPVPQKEKTENFFSEGTFSYLCRVKDIIFDTQEDGTPYVVNWKGQIIDLGISVGYSNGAQLFVSYNSGITIDKEVKNEATYQALKDDPDWFATINAYSRYNRASAVNTINSLPDTSAYLATAGGTNTIKFEGTSGSSTTAGGINTLTQEEIAVATAKGWTVAFV